MTRRLLFLLGFAVALVATGCRRTGHARVAGYVAPPLPAGFAEQTGNGWHVAMPTTWKPGPSQATWAGVDPQAVDDFHANVNVVTEPFTSDSYEYARASEAALRREPRATVENVREDVLDGDPTRVVVSRWGPAPSTTVSYRTMQAFLASRGTGYAVTCSVSASAFERYRTTCESILHSFAVER